MSLTHIHIFTLRKYAQVCDELVNIRTVQYPIVVAAGGSKLRNGFI